MLLQNAVALAKPLRVVKDQYVQCFTYSGKMINYDQHTALLLSSETGYNSQFSSASSVSARKFYWTELEDSDFEIDLPSAVAEDLEHAIDASDTTLLANITNLGNSDNYLPSDDY